MKTTTKLRQLLASDQMVVAPFVMNALHAKIAQSVGFDAVYMTGSGTSAEKGFPDVGMLTMTEMVGNAKYIANAVDVPVICDADTGYGNPLNVQRTVREYEAAGVAGIQLEDQEFPKRCGHLEGKQVVSATEMVAKIKAAKDEAGDDLLIVARTDSRAVLGLQEALERGHAYWNAGADILFIEAPRDLNELRVIAREFPEIPLLANIVEGGKTPYLSSQVLGEIGFALAIYPVTALLAATGAMQDILAQLSSIGHVNLEKLPTFSDLHEVSGLSNYLDDALEAATEES